MEGDLKTLTDKLTLIKENQNYSQRTIIDEIMDEMSSMSAQDMTTLASVREFKEAEAGYNQMFMAFLLDKFKGEFIRTNPGKQAADNLLSIIKQAKELIIKKNKMEFEDYVNNKEAFAKWKESINNKEDNG